MTVQGNAIRTPAAKRRATIALAGLLGLAGAIASGAAYLALRGGGLPVSTADGETGVSAAGKADRSPHRESVGSATTSSVPTGVLLNNSISRQAHQWGIATCIDQLAKVSDFLTLDRPSYSAVSRRGVTEADRQIFTATIVSRDAAGLDSVSTFVTAPVATGCNSAYQTVASFRAGCEEVRAAHFPTFNQKLNLAGSTLAYTNGRYGNVFLLPGADGSCTAVKNEVLY